MITGNCLHLHTNLKGSNSISLTPGLYNIASTL